MQKSSDLQKYNFMDSIDIFSPDCLYNINVKIRNLQTTPNKGNGK